MQAWRRKLRSITLFRLRLSLDLTEQRIAAAQIINRRRQTHTNVAPEALLHPQIEVHTDNLARNHLTVCSTLFAALYGFRGEAIEAT